MNHLSVAIADDNQKILDLLEKVIGTDQELDLVGKAKNGEEMCRIIIDKNPDVVLLDLIMPKMDGLTVMDQINQDIRELCDGEPVRCLDPRPLYEYKNGYLLPDYSGDGVHPYGKYDSLLAQWLCQQVA